MAVGLSAARAQRPPCGAGIPSDGIGQRSALPSLPETSRGKAPIVSASTGVEPALSGGPAAYPVRQRRKVVVGQAGSGRRYVLAYGCPPRNTHERIRCDGARAASFLVGFGRAASRATGVGKMALLFSQRMFRQRRQTSHAAASQRKKVRPIEQSCQGFLAAIPEAGIVCPPSPRARERATLRKAGGGAPTRPKSARSPAPRRCVPRVFCRGCSTDLPGTDCRN